MMQTERAINQVELSQRAKNIPVSRIANHKLYPVCQTSTFDNVSGDRDHIRGHLNTRDLCAWLLSRDCDRQHPRAWANLKISATHIKLFEVLQEPAILHHQPLSLLGIPGCSL
jgi:hypothetical protein